MVEIKKDREYTTAELWNFTTIYDNIIEYIKDKNIQSLFNAVFTEFKFLLNVKNNSDALNTPIIGRQFLINSKVQDKILSLFGLTYNDIYKILDKSEYLNSINIKHAGTLEFIAFCIPLLVLCSELVKKNKIPEAKTVYFYTTLKPYAGLISGYFKYGVNEDRMAYTVENIEKKYYINKYGTVYETLLQIVEASFNNYLDALKSNPTDHDLYVISMSGIKTRIASVVGSIKDAYMKNEGKYLTYQSSTAVSTDPESEGETFDLDINSDSAVKNRYKLAATNKFLQSPTNESLIEYCVAYNFKSTSVAYRDLLRSVISNIHTKFYKDMPYMFDYIIGAYLYSLDPTSNKRNSLTNIKTIKFEAQCMFVIQHSSNSKEKNILMVKEYLNKFLEVCSDYYITAKSDTTKRRIKYSVYLYFIKFIQKSI